MKIIRFISKGLNHIVFVYSLTLFVFGFLFGVYFYTRSNNLLPDLFGQLFYISGEVYIDNQNTYILISFFYYFLSFLASTSYMGVLLNSFIIYSKGIQVSFSIYNLFINGLSFELFILGVLPQILLEIVIVLIVSMLCLSLSVNVFKVSFVSHDIFKGSIIINYFLDYFIVILLLFILSIISRVYLV
ncbi:stage II sporulation protein M [Tannockella kyphosi]|uniref:stage II sporulation protein M n=1 Tax=Tannockella kyphosi TaxID=2899121 RepID=UPI002010EA14|nr:stage II sporulation protein M [Tannockella kyphosi]